jgi:hypothetical protein
MVLFCNAIYFFFKNVQFSAKMTIFTAILIKNVDFSSCPMVAEPNWNWKDNNFKAAVI